MKKSKNNLDSPKVNIFQKVGKKKTEKFQNPTTLNLMKEEDTSNVKYENKTLASIPTHDELKLILNKIADEIKEDHHHF